MRILFLMIFVSVFAIGHLISPDDFRYQNIELITTESAAEIETAETGEESGPVITPPASFQEDESASRNVTDSGQATEAPKSTNSGQTGTDPEILFGTPKTEDTFERGSSGFGLSAGLNDDENIRIIALNNRLSLEPKKDNGWINWRLRPPVINDGAAEMEFSIITCARGDRTGILMHSPDYSSGQGYYFSLSCEGTVSIMKDSTVLSTADARSSFKNSSGDANVITALILGNQLTIKLNGDSLITIQDDTYSEGFSGFFTSPQGQNTLTMDVISFKEYYNESVQ